MANTPAPVTNRWVPNLSGRVDPIVKQALDYLFQAIYSLQNGSLTPQGQKNIVAQTQNLTISAIQDKVTASVVKAISPGGTNVLPPPPPVPAGIPTVTVLPPPGDPLAVVGQAVNFNGQQWVYTANPAPGGAPFWKLSVAVGTSLSDTHANRIANFPPGNYAIGTSFYETDRTVTYQIQFISGANRWIYVNGRMNALLANIPTDLTLYDDTFWFNATDYQHQYTWSGSGLTFHFAAGDPGSDFYTTSLNPAGPNGGFWGKADGSTYAVAQDNGTTASVVSSSTANSWLRR